MIVNLPNFPATIPVHLWSPLLWPSKQCLFLSGNHLLQTCFRKKLGFQSEGCLSSFCVHFPSLNALHTQEGTLLLSLPSPCFPLSLLPFAAFRSDAFLVMRAVHLTQRSWWDKNFFFSSQFLALALSVSSAKFARIWVLVSHPAKSDSPKSTETMKMYMVLMRSSRA